MEEQVDFEELKEEVGILDVAERCGFDLRSTNGMYFYGYCKMPTHGSKHSKREFSICVPENYWQCWSSTCNRNNGGKRGGDIINFVSTFRGCTQREAALLIVEWFGRKPEGKKAPSSNGAMSEENDAHANREPVNANAQAEPVKVRYMQEVDKWFDGLMLRANNETDEAYWKRTRNGVKAKLLESYKNGKAAAQK